MRHALLYMTAWLTGPILWSLTQYTAKATPALLRERSKSPRLIFRWPFSLKKSRITGSCPDSCFLERTGTTLSSFLNKSGRFYPDICLRLFRPFFWFAIRSDRYPLKDLPDLEAGGYAALIRLLSDRVDKSVSMYFKTTDPWGNRYCLEKGDLTNIRALAFICVGPDCVMATDDDLVMRGDSFQSTFFYDIALRANALILLKETGIDLTNILNVSRQLQVESSTS